MSPNQHAYRKHHNTTTAMLQMVDNWIQGIECGQMAGVCMVDLSSAFDIVDHDLLLQKMALYGCSPSVIGWFSSYLRLRRQAVGINEILSKLVNVHCGVPQGSILGPLSYISFINELPSKYSQVRYD